LRDLFAERRVYSENLAINLKVTKYSTPLFTLSGADVQMRPEAATSCWKAMGKMILLHRSISLLATPRLQRRRNFTSVPGEIAEENQRTAAVSLDGRMNV
jgi:hypothetical protein